MGPTRRLAGILAADVAGYSRLMEADEEGTLERVKTLLDELVAPSVAQHDGRIFKTTGDGLLAEFASIVSAVRCAFGIQRALGDRNAGVEADRRIELRIGINLGDVIVVGDDLYGDGVNIACRIEALADAGGVLVSGTVHDQVRDRLPFAFEDLGEQRVKNLSRPIRVYRVRDLAATSGPAASDGPALPLPNKPSIAVLPFANLSDDRQQEYFADGMVEEIITSLSRIPLLFVIARNSTFTYKGRTVDVKQVGRELGVRYVLEGSVRKGGDLVRITAQLVDATTGLQLWADRFDGGLEDVFELQDQVAISVAGVIEPTLRHAEIERARRKRPDSLDAYDLYLRALPHVFTPMPEEAEKALALVGKAIELEPDFASAHAIIAWCHEQRYLRGGMLEEARIAALHHARQAIATGGDDAAALATAGFVIAVTGSDFETALSVLDRSFALSGSSALALGFSSIVRAWKGDDAIAVEQANRALRLSPFDPLAILPCIGLAYAHFAAGRFEQAAAAASTAARANPRFTPPQVLHAAALIRLDRAEEARTVVRRLVELQPGIDVPTAILSARYVNPESLAALRSALLRAGLSGG
jgi:adenylate cyclase